MKLPIQDTEALSAISPSALSAVALTLGWSKVDTYGDNSDVYSGNDLPEIVIPRIKELGDYSTVVSRLVGIFAKVTDKHELAIYKDLSSVDQDVVRVRIPSGDDGTLAMDGGVKLFKDIRDLVLAAARSLKNPQPVYHGRADSDAANLLKRVRLGQTEQGSYVVTLLVKITPPPPQQELSLAIESNNIPIERQLTSHFAKSLKSVKAASAKYSNGDSNAFAEVMSEGVNWNLCNALDSLITPYSNLDISMNWARTFPAQEAWSSISFNESDAVNLREAAEQFKLINPESPTCFRGFVRQLKRNQDESDGNVQLVISDEGNQRIIRAKLNKNDYSKAIQAHQRNALVSITGNPQRSQTQWKLLDAKIENFIQDDDEPSEETGISDLFTSSGIKEI